MDFKNVDLSNFKIPDIAQGKVIPYGVYKHLEQDGKEKKQRSHNWEIAIFGAIITVITCAASIIIPFYLNQLIK